MPWSSTSSSIPSLHATRRAERPTYGDPARSSPGALRRARWSSPSAGAVEQRQHLLEARDRSEMGVDVVEAGILLSIARRRDAILHHDDVVAAEERVVRGGAHADVRHDPREDQRRDPLLPQTQVEVRLIEPRVAALLHAVFVVARLECLDDLRSPGPAEAMHRSLLELSVV